MTPVDLAPGPHRIGTCEFVAAVAPVDGYATFDELVSQLTADPEERVIIDELLIEYRRDGKFREPLRVHDAVLENGCHRFCALTLAQAAHLDIWVCDDDHPDPRATVARTIFEFNLEIRDTAGRFEDRDELFIAASSLGRSFPLDGLWVEGDSVSSCGSRISFPLYCPTERVAEAGAALVARLETLGVTVELIDVERWPDED